MHCLVKLLHTVLEFSMDRLTHAINTVENMKRIANEAIEGTLEVGEE